MTENYAVSLEDGRSKDSLYGFSNAEGAKHDLIFMTRISWGSFNWLVL